MADDAFSGKSRLNLVAAGCFLTAFAGPLGLAFVFRQGIPDLDPGTISLLAWIGAWVFLGILLAFAADVRERFARIETRVGLRPPPGGDSGDESPPAPPVGGTGGA